jgi:hypothetical protein
MNDTFSAYGPEDPPESPEAEARAAAVNDVGDQLLANLSPPQRENAGDIYHRLRAGADPDGLKPLIARLSRTATDDARRRGAPGHGGRIR